MKAMIKKGNANDRWVGAQVSVMKKGDLSSWRIWLGLFLVLLLLFSYLGETPWAGGNTVSEWPFQVDTNSAWCTPEGFYCGTIQSIYLPIRQLSEAPLTIKAVYLDVAADSATYPFVINQLRYLGQEKDDISDDSALKIYGFGPLQVRADVNDGYYNLNFTVVYSMDGTPGLFEQKLSYFARFYAKPKEEKPTEKETQRFLLESADLPIAQGVYGGPIQLQFGVINRGFDVADIISVTPVVSGDANTFPFEITRSDYTIPVDEQLWPVSAEQTPSVEGRTLVLCDFGQLTLRKKVSSGYKKIDFNIKFKYGSQQIQEAVLSTFVDIVGNPEEDGKKDDERKPVPRLICLGYTTEPEKVMGGKPFDLKIRLKNTSIHTAIQNIRIVLVSTPTDDGEPFVTASGASSIFVPRIEADSEFLLEVKMIGSVKLPQKTYPLHIKMEYEDLKNSSVTADESISIQLRQEARVDIGKMEVMPAGATVGQDVNVMFPIYNKGKMKLYNVSVVVPPDQAVTAVEAYVGNMDPGATSQLDTMVRCVKLASTEQPQKIQLRYEDENGLATVKDFQLPIDIKPKEEQQGGGMPGEVPSGEEGVINTEEGEGKNLPRWAWGAIAGASFLLLLLILMAARRKRKRKLLQMEDENYFQDMMH